MKLTLVIVAAVLPMFVAVPRAADVDLQAFVGTWQEDPSQSRHAISGALTYTFAADDSGFVIVTRANTPFRERVRFDGADYAAAGQPGRTGSWTKVSETVYESTMKRDGVVIATTRWTISDAGSRLSQATRPVRANGDDDTNIIEYVRVSGAGTSLLGVWKPVSTRSAVPDLFVITRAGDELRVFYPKYGSVVYTIRLDGMRHPFTQPGAAPEMTGRSDAIGPRDVRRTTFQRDTPTLESVMRVSADGRAMTITTQSVGSSDAPSVIVYEKQE